MVSEDAPSFVPYATMFKLEPRSRIVMLHTKRGRALECVNCGTLLGWSTYTLDPSGFDRMCHKCKMTAQDFWKGKPHKELDDG